MRILIDLPADTIKALERLAKSENRSRKNYIETILVSIAQKNVKELKKPTAAG